MSKYINRQKQNKISKWISKWINKEITTKVKVQYCVKKKKCNVIVKRKYFSNHVLDIFNNIFIVKIEYLQKKLLRCLLNFRMGVHHAMTIIFGGPYWHLKDWKPLVCVIDKSSTTLAVILPFKCHFLVKSGVNICGPQIT